MPALQARLPDLEWHPKHGAHTSISPPLTLLSPSSLFLSSLPSSFSPASLLISTPESTATTIVLRNPLTHSRLPRVNQLLAEHEIG